MAIVRTVLIIGANSFLGRKLRVEFSQEYLVIGTHHTSPGPGTLPLDITDAAAVRTLIATQNPDIVLLVAAQTNVDACERDPEMAEAINVRGVVHVAACCENRKLVYYSTDAVFDGVCGNYVEEDTPNPLHQYGRTKLAGERIVQALSDHLIIRTCMLYGDEQQNPKFINAMIRTLTEGMPMRVITDRYATPTLIDDLARATHTLVQQHCVGIYHVCGASALSCSEMADIVARVFSFDRRLLIPVADTEVSLPAKRPKHATLSIAKLRAAGIRMSTFEEGIRKIWKSLRP